MPKPSTITDSTEAAALRAVVASRKDRIAFLKGQTPSSAEQAIDFQNSIARCEKQIADAEIRIGQLSTAS